MLFRGALATLDWQPRSSSPVGGGNRGRHPVYSVQLHATVECLLSWRPRLIGLAVRLDDRAYFNDLVAPIIAHSDLRLFRPATDTPQCVAAAIADLQIAA